MKILPLFLALGHALAVPAIAEQRLLKLVARSLTPEPSFTIQDGEQMTILSVLVSEDLARSAVAVEVRYVGIDATFRLDSGDHISGPATVTLRYAKRTGREVAVAECLWTFNTYAASPPLQSLAIQRSEDASTWSTIRTFEDRSTNAFYRWKIEPRQ